MFEKPPVAVIGPCNFGVWLTELSDDDRSNLGQWLESRTITNAAIIRQIEDETGRRFNKDTVSFHRSGRCRCSRN